MSKQGSCESEGKDLRYLMPSFAYFSIFLQPFIFSSESWIGLTHGNGLRIMEIGAVF